MTNNSIDVLYAYLQLGLDQDASSQDIERVLAHALSYRFSTKARIQHVHRYARFFSEREKLGPLSFSFVEIRKAYHEKVKELHPDRHKGNKALEDLLKEINAAYGLIDEIYREARGFYQKDEKTKLEIEAEARATRQQEEPIEYKAEKAEEDSRSKSSFQSNYRREQRSGFEENKSAVPSVKYFAASIPRYIRASRLFYLPRKTIIGSLMVHPKGSIPMVYDVVMLPEKEFMRAKLYLGTEISGAPELRMSNITPAYIPRDTKVIFVPLTEEDPEQYALNHFIREFSMENR